jgi:alpha-L-fucosidase
VNGEAIYGTRPWLVAVEGTETGTSGAFTDNTESQYTAQDIRFTRKGEVLYAISLDWTDDEIIISSIHGDYKVNEVSMLGSDETLVWSQTDEGLKVGFPRKKPTEYAHALKIMFQ